MSNPTTASIKDQNKNEASTMVKRNVRKFMNNKLALARRIAGYKAAEDIIAPLTGELLVAKGEKINTTKANEIDAAGVTRVVVLVERKGKYPGQWLGKSPWLQSVHFTGEAEIGALVDVELVEAGPNSLAGRLIA